MISFLTGAVTLAYLLGAFFFLRFWRRTADRLFAVFAVAFVLFAINQTLTLVLGTTNELRGSIYILRVVGYVLILFAIVDKNVFARK
jgi:hypothetical protein